MLAEVFKYLAWAVSPLGIWILGIAATSLGLFGRRRWRVFIVGLCTAQLMILSLPWVGDQLLGALESEAKAMQLATPLPDNRPVDAIVLLGGSTESAFQGWRDLPDLNHSADRIWLAARLYRQGVAPVLIVSGGGFEKDPRIQPEAQGMKAVLEDFGVPESAIVLENQSRTTLENAQYTIDLIKKKAVPGAEAFELALVTSAFHMKRAAGLFDHPELTVYPVRADIRVVPEDKPLWRWLPNADGLEKSTIALRERLGLLQRFVKKWFEQ